MPLKLQVHASTVYCGKCGKRYTSPFGHTCIVRKPRGKTRLKPKLKVSLVKCPRCGKDYSNPLTHTCKTKSDFKKRKSAWVKAAERRSGAVKTQHRYENCGGDQCTKYGCRVYREGVAEGMARATPNGGAVAQAYADGHSAGYSEGHSAGQAEAGESGSGGGG